MSCVAVHHIRPPLLRCLFSTRLRVKVTQTQTHLDPSSSCTSPSLSPLTHPPPVSSLDTHNLPSFNLQRHQNITARPSVVRFVGSSSFSFIFKTHPLFIGIHPSIQPSVLFYLYTPKTSSSSSARQRNTTNTKKAQHCDPTPRYTTCNAQHPVSISIPFNRLSTIMIIQVDTDISLSPSLASFARSLRLVSSSPFHSVVIGRWPSKLDPVDRRLCVISRHPPPVALSQMHSASTLKLALDLALKFDPWRLEDGTRDARHGTLRLNGEWCPLHLD